MPIQGRSSRGQRGGARRVVGMPVGRREQNMCADIIRETQVQNQGSGGSGSRSNIPSLTVRSPLLDTAYRCHDR